MNTKSYNLPTFHSSNSYSFLIPIHFCFAHFLITSLKIVLSSHCPQDTEEMIPCPLCGIVLPRSAVIIHAGSCVGTSDTMQPLAEVPKHVQLNAFSRRNEAQLYKDGIPSTVKDCTDVAILNTNDCKKGVPHVTLQTTEGIHVHVSPLVHVLMSVSTIINNCHVPSFVSFTCIIINHFLVLSSFPLKFSSLLFSLLFSCHFCI